MAPIVIYVGPIEKPVNISAENKIRLECQNEEPQLRFLAKYSHAEGGREDRQDGDGGGENGENSLCVHAVHRKKSG